MRSSGTPDEFEAMRKKIPFGKKVIKQQDEGKQKQIEAGDDGEETCRAKL
ncbi:hypothetical protein PC129_g15796 [Phytophthora cactorum]|uniref:Uncharacterized protein n=1 Tax=Phytophthora cactorum TaxID=29920 RepID=A0A329RAV0_9STRA|nr:hypothetical protein PC112_g18198 [Phytophthora cactorum]KAG2807087.1 hypothetical protein PC111_g17072 [Phytophthora cactorum]KAG2846325.1 hypothetical protein PC113_g17989 [Phytophthora cactorum]KAG2885179.1 hypothetical protein PC114_g19802 [Phytophthora cactorum]KAG2901525.1 hypothetical protein PC115_g15852 [Phytophthora cactorum]